MHRFYAVFIFLIVFQHQSIAQYSCHDAKAEKYRGGDQTWYRSAFDNLRSDTMDILHYDVQLDVTDFTGQNIKGGCTVKYTPKLNNIGTLSLDLLQMNIDSIIEGGSNLTYSYNDTLIVIQLPAAISQGDTSELTVYYNGTPQQDASGWGGWYFSGSHAYNLGVGFAADPHNYGRVWHPCFDNFAERATYDFSILTSGGKTAYCNGDRISVTTVSGDTIETKWQLSTPIPSYLASVAVSNYTHARMEHVSTLNGDTIPIWLIAQPGDTTAFKTSFTNVDLAIQGFEELYGQHVWNKVGFVLVPFSSGAMEHPTNIAYPAVAANGSTIFETLMAHELSHHWWGDNITCLTEEEMWINEGMATYSEKLFLEYAYGTSDYMAQVRNNHESVLHKAHIIDSGYYALDAVPHAYTYGEHSYNKGSDVVHTMRGYMGDSLFFAGLQSVQNNFTGKNLSSVQFRDHLNTIPGIDVTDFFEDWIFNPGFSQFSIDSFSVSGNGPYTVQVYVRQKLRGAPTEHDNVPLQIRFMDDNWNEHNQEIVMSGPTMSFSLSCPFSPDFAAINMNERINDATTSQNVTISSTGLVDMPYAHFLLNPLSVGDSVMVRVEHNWVPADPFINQPPDMIVSRDRYWNVHSIGDMANLQGTMRIEYNAQNNLGGNLDNLLLADLGGQPFKEDSIVLLYRAGASENWSEHPDYSVNFQGSATDKKGAVIINTIADGQYALGYKTPSVGIKEIKSTGHIHIFPNPSNSIVKFDVPEGNYRVILHDLNGRSVSIKRLNGNALDVSHLSSGTYLASVFKSEQFIGTAKIIVSAD